jgi:hypothetical protein
MSNIYKQKAEKYKYKYLKLKQAYISEGGSFKNFFKKLFNLITYAPNCTTTPPISLDGLNITQEYIEHGTNIKDIINDNHVGSLLSYNDDIYNKIFEKFIILKKHDPNHKYTSELKYAGNMSKNDFIKFINNKNKKDGNEIYKFIDECHENLKSSKYGYIISTNVGISFDRLGYDDINDNNIKDILISLREGIINFITNIFEEEYILGDINFENMTLKDNKVYFINYGKMHKYTDKDQIKKFADGDNYPYILKRFFKIKENEVNKEYLINFFNDNKVSNPKEYIFSYLNEKTQYNIDEIYEKYIFSIAKNSDIYALSVFINSIFDKTLFNVGKTKKKNTDDTNNTDDLVKNLHVDAIFNKIENYDDLSNRLQQIIDSLPDK